MRCPHIADDDIAARQQEIGYILPCYVLHSHRMFFVLKKRIKSEAEMSELTLRIFDNFLSAMLFSVQFISSFSACELSHKSSELCNTLFQDFSHVFSTILRPRTFPTGY